MIRHVLAVWLAVVACGKGSHQPPTIAPRDSERATEL